MTTFYSETPQHKLSAIVQSTAAPCRWLAVLRTQRGFKRLIVLLNSGHRYGFRTPPHLELKARPKLGEREVTLAHVTDWIEKKLDQEFQVRLRLKKNMLGICVKCLNFTFLFTINKSASALPNQKVFVMPNMDDIWLTIMHSAMDSRTATGPTAPSVDTEWSPPQSDSHP